ncbi:hypothetical protein KIS1582_2718 [Cytobacillus firmus]|uniref:Uncharacterized protein n=1 Tax=Cytobacillus firmus TaxID=1399 RepID=A0A800MVX4_CYTFI|nr:hypothetical protein KIS1582_2718 [Cytobacillus firmus]
MSLSLSILFFDKITIIAICDKTMKSFQKIKGPFRPFKI